MPITSERTCSLFVSFSSANCRLNGPPGPERSCQRSLWLANSMFQRNNSDSTTDNPASLNNPRAAAAPAHSRSKGGNNSAGNLGLLLVSLVLNDITVLKQDSVLHSDNIRRNPVDRQPEAREPAVDDDEVSLARSQTRPDSFVPS